jgi:hypothetical protein
MWGGRAMKFVILVALTACAAALAIFAVPSNLIPSDFGGVEMLAARSGLDHFTLADLNPLRFVFDYERQRINAGDTPEQLGFHPSPVILSPVQMPTTNLDRFKGPLGPGGYDPQAYMEMQQNNQRMDAMRHYMNDPTHWVGPPPG